MAVAHVLLPRVSVVGSGTVSHPERARPLGRALAELPVHLVTGGGAGVMAEVSRAFTSVAHREGLCVGILPSRNSEGGPPEPPPGYPNPWVELPIATHLPARGTEGSDFDSRNHLVVLTADVVVALPGGDGTRTEVELALRYGRPVLAHLESRDEIPALPAAVALTSDGGAVLDFIAEHLWRDRG